MRRGNAAYLRCAKRIFYQLFWRKNLTTRFYLLYYVLWGGEGRSRVFYSFEIEHAKCLPPAASSNKINTELKITGRK